MSVLDNIREQIKAALDERAATQAEFDAVIDGAEKRGDQELTADETAKVTELRAKLAELDAKRVEIEGREKVVAEAEEAKAAATRSAERFGGTAPTSVVHVGQEPLTYRADGEHSYLQDLYRSQRGQDLGASQRIERHAAEMRVEHRDAATSAFGALVVPQYLTDLFTPNLRAGRPFLNVVRSVPLPDEGMTFNVPRGTTATTVLQQTTENSAVDETDFDETTLTIPVRTHSGQQDVSRQALDRGRGIEAIVMADLADAYVTRVDWEAINGTGASGTMYGVRSTTGISTVTFSGTSLSSGVVDFNRKVADAIQQINGSRFAPPDVIVMHPRRWGWLTSMSDSNGRPLVTPGYHGPQNVFGIGEAAGYGPVGEFHGLPVITDANIPTTVSTSTITGATEDVVIITRSSDLIHWNDGVGPLTVEFKETTAGSLTVKIVAWGYNAFDAGRYPTATRIITGSSLGAPSF